jgi:hypothetical protein
MDQIRRREADHTLVRNPPMSKAGNSFLCVCCDKDKPEDGTERFDNDLGGPVCGICHFRLCLASKWLARGYKWKEEHGDEAKQYEGPCSSRVIQPDDLNESNHKRFLT